MNKSRRPDRLELPTTLAGDYTALVIGTFGADLAFAEAQLFRQLSRTTVNRVVLADARQLAAYLARTSDVRRLNRSYIAGPVRSPHAHHPKYVMLVGPEAGLLHVGSGNLSISGYASAGECFSTYLWAPGAPASVDAFAAVRHLIAGQTARGWLDHVTNERLADIFAACPWIPEQPARGGPVVHNLDVSLIDQLVDQIDGRAVGELVAAAPFHDRSADAIDALLTRLRPATVTLLVQDGITRLDRRSLKMVIARHAIKFNLCETTAPSPYPATFLHAKFLLARTDTGDVLLQGSANLSAIALCKAGQDANVEIANLLEGEAGSFNSLLDAVDVRPIAGGLDAFSADTDWSNDESDDALLAAAPRSVCWAAPRLTGVLPDVGAQQLEVRVAGREVEPEHRTWTVTAEGREFALDFANAESERVDHAPYIELVTEDGSVWTVYPYHLYALMRLTSAGHRVELLQEVGDLDLRDKELEELLAELDRVLIVDGRSLWRLAHPQEVVDDAPDESAKLQYEEIDWARVGELPQLKQYESAAHRALLAPTELGVVLQALTGRFRADVLEGLGLLELEVTEGDDLAKRPDAEDPDDADDASGDEDASDDQDEDGDDAQLPRRLTARSRVRRVWRNFVRRFTKGLADETFVTSVGSHVIIPSFIVFNHLCRRLRVVDLVDADFLTESQIKLWAFMWGDGRSDGYLARLPDAERAMATTLLAEHDDLAVTLAALDDAWWHVYDDGDDPRQLRSAWRAFLSNPHWEPTENALNDAAAAAMHIGADRDLLYEDLLELAVYADDSERDQEIADVLGITRSDVSEQEGDVKRHGVKEHHVFLKLGTAIDLTPDLAAEAIAVWKDFESGRSYFRLRAGNAVAVVDELNGVREFIDTATFETSELPHRSRTAPMWQSRLQQLLEMAA